MYARPCRALLLALILALASLPPCIALAESRFVQVAKTGLHVEAGFLNRVTDSLEYGDAVVISGETDDGKWVLVKSPGKEPGWLHSSALTAKRLILKAGEKSVQVRPDQVKHGMVGKGFSRETEDDYKQQNPQLPFDALERIDRAPPSTDEVVEFATQGGLMR
jgi:hypothetical protein